MIINVHLSFFNNRVRRLCKAHGMTNRRNLKIHDREFDEFVLKTFGFKIG